MNYTEHKKLSGFLLFIDFEKAFDSTEWDFMIKCLEKFNFGKDILTWVKTLYNDVSSCVINNGTTCQYFKIGKGARQGDPLSPYLFIICVEMLAIAIRSNKIIKGIHMGEEFKLTQFADDLTCLLSDIQSGKELFKLINKFEICSGLKLNISKTEALWIGKDKNKTEKPFNIKWSTKPIKVLGIYIGHNKEEAYRANFEPPLQLLDKQLALWKRRSLSLKEKVLIVKTLGISKFTFLSKVLHISCEIKKEINSLL